MIKKIAKTKDGFSVMLEENNSVRIIPNLTQHEAFLILYADDMILDLCNVVTKIDNIGKDKILSGDEIYNMVIKETIIPVLQIAIEMEAHLDILVGGQDGNKL